MLGWSCDGKIQKNCVHLATSPYISLSVGNRSSMSSSTNFTVLGIVSRVIVCPASRLEAEGRNQAWVVWHQPNRLYQCRCLVVVRTWFFSDFPGRLRRRKILLQKPRTDRDQARQTVTRTSPIRIVVHFLISSRIQQGTQLIKNPSDNDYWVVNTSVLEIHGWL